MAGEHATADATRPASDAVNIAPSDATVIPITRAIWVGTAGDVVVKMARTSNIITFRNVPVGILPVQVIQVRAASTAALMVALY